MNYQKTIILSAFLFLITLSQAQIGDMFPNVEGESLDNEKVMIPKDIEGKYSIVGMAWSKRSEEALERWFVPVYDLFIDKKTFIPIDYDVNIYFIPMFSGFKKGAYKSVMADSKKQLGPKLSKHVLFYKGSIKDIKSNLSLKDKNIPYFFVLDKTGKIVYSTSGNYTDDKLEKMEEFISK